MTPLTREQMTIRLNYIAAMLEPDDMAWFEPLRDMALRACDAPEVAKDAERLRAVLEGLECENVSALVSQRPEILKAVASEIAKAAKLGSNLYAAMQAGSKP